MSSGDRALNWFSESEMQVLQISSRMAQKWTEEVIRRYSENTRYYHTLQHISDMMNHFHTWREQLTDHAAVMLAILFHDIVYDPQSFCNEVDSIELFKTFAEEVVLKDELSNKVTELIRATIKHLPDDTSSADSDLLFFLDFDMAILGQSQEVYDVYAPNIRKEYCHMSTEDFCQGRTKVLQTFMARPMIYFTKEFHKACEGQARENILREIERLQQQLVNIA
ncbi:hypothetical protein ACOMHN_003085 [Nucella lapillus]